jgi:hypothetical protein
MKRSKRKRVILFEDETGLSLHPKFGRVWAKRGSQPYVYTRSQHQKRMNLFGWEAPFQGWHGMMKQPKGDTDSFLKLLHSLLSRFKQALIDLWVDRAKWHRGERVRQFCFAYRQVQIHYLPPYHTELNYQETLRRTMRSEETTNAFF